MDIASAPQTSASSASVSPAGLDIVVCTAAPARRDVLRRCLTALTRELLPGDCLFLIVDNDARWLEELRTWSFRTSGTVVVAPSAARPGLSGARNTGLQLSAGRPTGPAPWICFIDDDAVARPGWRAALAPALAPGEATVQALGEAGAEVIGIAGYVYPDYRDAAGQPRPRPRWLAHNQEWALGCEHPGMAAGSDLRNPIGAAMVIRRAALDSLAQPEFSLHLGRVGSGTQGGEETELFLRLRSLFPAAVVQRVPGFAVDHEVPPRRARVGYLLRRAWGEGRSKAALRALATGQFSGEQQFLTRALRSVQPLELGMLLLAGAGFLSGRVWHRPLAAPAVAGTDPAPELSVVLCTTGTSPHLRQAVGALASSDPVTRCEIIVVDNSRAAAGAEAIARIVAEYRAATPHELRVVREPRPGLSRARNRGWQSARAELVAFSDDDVIVPPDWARRVVEAFAEPAPAEAVPAEDVAPGCSGRISPPWCVTGRTVGVNATAGPEQLFELLGGFDKGDQACWWGQHSPQGMSAPPLYPYPAGCFGSGNNMAFRAAALAEIGGFAEELGAGRATRGGEDLDAFRSIILHGGSIFYTPAAVVGHVHRATLPALARQMFGYGTGMAASLGRCALDSPAHGAAILRGIPAGAWVFLRKRLRVARPTAAAKRPVTGAAEHAVTAAAQEKQARVPAWLIALELLGYVCGLPLLVVCLFQDAWASLRATQG